MKKIVLGIFSLAVVAGANAQSGTVLVGGNVGVETNKDAEETKTTSFNIAPFVGYQFNDNWTVGVTGGVGFAKEDPKGSDEVEKATAFRVGPFVRYTQPISDIFSIFGQLEGGYQGLNKKTEITDNNTTTSTTLKANGGYARLFPAVFINVKNGFGLNFDFGGVEFNTMKVKDADHGENNFKFNFGKTVNIGISKNF
ncbi:outer membrane beta-barrel protein [Niabella beijingensis]|uniref:outer membrane beta-barrel protein n=1 Tax=Niabella beijingensis TaxID=2872700 RepID=UPI001CBF34C1|nr:outer membrane beta-barrel protein [Niabella beijingensis]MBZ4190021.1 porin family protein [Niabella beijingensis]